MSTHRIPLAIAASVCTFAVASTTFAQEVPRDPAALEPQPAPPQPPPVVQDPPPPVAPAPQPQAQPQPVSTTQTTQATYATSSDRITEETRRTWPNKKVLITGGSIFALSYGASVLVAAQSDREADNRLYIPGVGPWLDLGQRHCDAATPCGDNENVAKAFIIASGAAQGVGVLMAVSSLFIPERETRQVTTTTTAAKPEVRVLPLTFAGGGGVGAIGRF